MAQNVLDALVAKFGDAILETSTDGGDDVALVSRDKLVEVATYLRDDEAMKFDFPVFVTCIDRLWLDEEGPRFHVCFQVRSGPHRHRLRLKVPLEDSDPKLPTLTTVWPGMNWLERETYDMYGIVFDGHPDLRRIFMYEEFSGHPLRKDYPKERRQPLVRRDWSDEPSVYESQDVAGRSVAEEK